jgi:thiamine transport system permease protein
MGILVVIPLVFIAVFFVWPVATLVARGFVSPTGGIDLSEFSTLMSAPRTWKIVGRTVGQAVVATAVIVVLAIPTAHVLYRRSFPGRGAVRAAFTVPFVLPSVVVGMAFRTLLSTDGPLGFLHLDGTFAAVVAALVFFNLGLMVRILGNFWAAMDPRPEQAARVLGAGPGRAFATVTLPALTPALAAGASMVFLFCSTAFAIVMILGGPAYGTIETEIWMQTTQMLNLRAASVLSVLQLVLVVVALWISGAARRRRERALKLTGMGPRARVARLNAADAGPALVAAAGLVLIIAPMASLVARSLRTRSGYGLANYEALASDNLGGLPYSLLDAAGHSVRIALVATAIALALGICMGIVLSRRPRSTAVGRLQSALDGLFMAPLGVSAVTVGFGFLITLNRPPVNLRTSFWLIPLAQALVALPLVVRSILPVLRAIDPRQRQAAAVLGASPVRVFATVDGPVMSRALSVAGAYALAVSLGEFGATSFLARPETTTLPVAIYRLMGRPGLENMGAALAGSVLLGAVTCGIMALAEWRRGPEGAEL